MGTRKKRVESQAFSRQLQGDHPDVFCWVAPKPLAVTMNQQIRDAYPDIDKQTRSNTLRIWVSRVEYQQALLAVDAVRLNLDWTPEMPVTPEHQKIADERLSGLMKVRVERNKQRKAELKARLNRSADMKTESSLEGRANVLPGVSEAQRARVLEQMRRVARAGQAKMGEKYNLMGPFDPKWTTLARDGKKQSGK